MLNSSNPLSSVGTLAPFFNTTASSSNLTPAAAPASSVSTEGSQDVTQLSGTHINACGCNACCASADFSSDGTVIEDDFAFQTSNFLWSQPNGKGSAITITYSYSNLFNGGIKGGITQGEMKSAVQEAFRLWSRYAPLNFVEVRDSGTKSRSNPNAADIRIGNENLGGPGGTLGRATLRYDGELAVNIAFDNQDRWETDRVGNEKSDFLMVAVHEIGHALGLRHESTQQAVMQPFVSDVYNGLGSAFLYTDDINGIRAVYGQGRGSLRPLGSTTPSNPTPPNPSAPRVVKGTQRNDVLRGDSRAQKFKGLGGNDTIRAGGGNDTLLGGSGDDKLFGQGGRDRLVGTSGGTRPGLNERDVLTGGGDSDLFVLGDRQKVFYNDGKANTLGKSDYALIKDFNRASGDRIQLKGRASKYRLGAAPSGTENGQGIFLKTKGQDELIAVVRGNNGLSLQSSDFTFV